MPTIRFISDKSYKSWIKGEERERRRWLHVSKHLHLYTHTCTLKPPKVLTRTLKFSYSLSPTHVSTAIIRTNIQKHVHTNSHTHKRTLTHSLTHTSKTTHPQAHSHSLSRTLIQKHALISALSLTHSLAHTSKSTHAQCLTHTHRRYRTLREKKH